MSHNSPTINAQLIAQTKIKNGEIVYNFGLGANPFPPNKILLDKFKESCHLKNYTYPNGDDDLLEIIKIKYSSTNYKVNNILVGNGLKELLFIVQMVFKGTIFHIYPAWVSYMEQTKLLNKKVVNIKTEFNNNCKLTPNLLETTLHNYFNNINTQNDKILLLFNSPNNPTGVAYSDVELQQLAKIINKYKDNIVVFSDEIYKNIMHAQNTETSISTYVPNTICGSSLSKEAACGGWRMAWLTFPESLNYLYYDAFHAISTTYSCVSQPLIEVAKEYISNRENEIYTRHMSNIFSQATIIVRDIIKKSSDIKIICANSAWYLFLCADNYADRLKTIGIISGKQLSERIINDINVITVPGECFGYNGYYLRLSCIDFVIHSNTPLITPSFNKIKIGAQILAAWFNALI